MMAYLRNEDKLAYNRKYRETHREQRADYSRRYYAEHEEERKAYRAKWYEANKEEIAERSRQYREDHKEEVAARLRAWERANREKTRAHGIVKRALKSGLLVRPSTCEECGISGVRIEAHHADYSKPLDVEWLCVKDHRAR